ncbi:Peptidase Vpr; Serine peptidase; MEROPS family S08A [Bacillus cereus Rock3-28]|nr:Peptidase Vpr; Serine peptidase; MEROPS family S08A [Bacillus cereus Rock3-28]
MHLPTIKIIFLTKLILKLPFIIENSINLKLLFCIIKNFQHYYHPYIANHLLYSL